MALVRQLATALAAYPNRVVACSGGVDSLLLADLAHTEAPESTVIVHSVTPAVPAAATQRVRDTAVALGWNLREITSAEFEDERYLRNPVDRCYFCKTNLYDEIDRISAEVPAEVTILSGANVDDRGEYRPGLQAAAEHRVRHPYLDAGLGKADIRKLAAQRDRTWHDLPAAPCLASRLYTGTTVTPSLVRAVDRGESLLQQRLHPEGAGVLRCRIDGTRVRVEVPAADQPRLDESLLAEVLQAMQEVAPTLCEIEADAEEYRSGRAFIGIPTPVQPDPETAQA